MQPHHDHGYKELFSYPEMVQQLMQGFAPPEIAALLDYSTLEQQSGSYITPLFDEHIEDVVWSVQMKPTAPSAGAKPEKTVTIYLYILLEFQSRMDRTMPLRMLHYTASFYYHLLKNKNIKVSRNRLPPVFPIVLYNGPKKWRVPQDMQSVIQTVPDFLRKYQPQLHYYIIQNPP